VVKKDEELWLKEKKNCDLMEYEFVLKKERKEIFRKKGNEDLENVAKKIDAIIVKQK